MDWTSKTVIIALTLMLSACSVSYKFNGASIDYNKTKTIQIADFPIRSSYVWGPMSAIFNNQLKDQFATQTRLIQVRRNGDLKIEGEITQYQQRNRAVTSEGFSAMTELSMTVNVRFTNNTNHEQDFEQQFTATASYESTRSLNSVQEEYVTQMSKDITVYDLRSLIAQYPYYQTARLLMLKNLYILHDPTFDEELRRAAIYITDRKVIFNLVESAHYQLKTTEKTADEKKQTKGAEQRPSTNELIDKFLETIPVEEEKDKSKKRKPTAADAAIDYVAYLLETEEKEDVKSEETESSPTLDLIDTFISNNEQGRIELKENIEYVPEIADEGDKNGENEDEEGYFTETLARIYIKQGRYSQALEIIKRLNLAYPKKNAYFADQIRFLEKLIINNNNKNK